MENQDITLQKEIKELEAKLMQSCLHSDVFTTTEIFKQLEIKKSLLLNIK